MFTWNHDGRSGRLYIHLTTLMALFSGLAWSQTQLATIFGTMTDPSGAMIPEAAVTIVNRSTGLKREVLTGTTGQYHVPGLPTGDYVVRIAKPGFQTQVREAITVTSASEVMINASLTISDQPQQVFVTESPTAIDNTTSAVSGLVSQKRLAELPFNGRDLFQAVVLEPGVAPTPSSAPSLLSSGKAGQVSINGMRPNSTNLLIDGLDANDPVFGFSPAVSGLFLGLDELAEVHVLTQTPGAEFGRAGGGVVEDVTKSGSNHFHGSLFELHRSAALDAKNYFDLSNAPKPAFVRNQFGAAVGGPLVHDRTFFFANYEGFRQVQAATAIATVPNALDHQTAGVVFAPRPNVNPVVPLIVLGPGYPGGKIFNREPSQRYLASSRGISDAMFCADPALPRRISRSSAVSSRRACSAALPFGVLRLPEPPEPG